MSVEHFWADSNLQKIILICDNHNYRGFVKYVFERRSTAMEEPFILVSAASIEDRCFTGEVVNATFENSADSSSTFQRRSSYQGGLFCQKSAMPQGSDEVISQSNSQRYINLT